MQFARPMHMPGALVSHDHCTEQRSINCQSNYAAGPKMLKGAAEVQQAGAVTNCRTAQLSNHMQGGNSTAQSGLSPCASANLQFGSPALVQNQCNGYGCWLHLEFRTGLVRASGPPCTFCRGTPSGHGASPPLAHSNQLPISTCSFR